MTTWTEPHNPRLPDWQSFVLAGKAVFTVKNEQTGNRLTFKVTHADDPEKDLWFVSVLRGTDNESDYSYVGIIRGSEFRLTAKSRVTEEAPAYRVFRWLYQHILAQKDLPGCVHVYHEGKCGRCGRTLTVPESIETGFGPECIKHVWK